MPLASRRGLFEPLERLICRISAETRLSCHQAGSLFEEEIEVDADVETSWVVDVSGIVRALGSQESRFPATVATRSDSRCARKMVA